MTEKQKNFIQRIIDEDNLSGKFDNRVHTRFPPEPNGYLHIGHAKAICLNFNIANEYGGKCNLRFDDTNPVSEDIEYVNAIKDDVAWLGYSWDDRLCFASDYFEEMHKYAVQITVADSRDGACSSSTLKEASSWGKVDVTKEQMVFAEATSVLPLIASDAYHKGEWKNRSRKNFSKIFG